MKIKLFFVSAILVGLSLLTTKLQAQTVTFNDNDLKTYLLTLVDASGGGNGDGEVQTSEALTLTDLFYQGNGLTDATGLEAFTNLEELYLDNNSLSDIDLSTFSNLTVLSLNSNDFETIDLGGLSSLQSLSIGNNSLNVLDVSDISTLTGLIAGSNNLTEMDLSSNNLLTVVKLQYNDLESLNLRNGANASITNLLITNNFNLTCVEVDDVTAANGYAGWTKETGTSYAISCEPIVTVNDSNFKTYLLSQVDSNEDGEIQVSEAENFTGTISYRNKGEAFSDATGLEAFINASVVFIDRNNISTLDVSQNTGLTKLVAYTNPISTIDLSANVLLEELYLGFTNIETLNTTNLTELKRIEMVGTPLHTLDLEQNTKLEALIIYDNDLNELDLTTNVLLSDLKIFNNGISELSLTTNTMLIELWAHSLLLNEINLSQNTLLEVLYLQNNNLTSIDLSQNGALTGVYLQNNNLQELQLDNGNNASISEMVATGNSNLTCIQVDHVANAVGYSGWSKDETANYVTDCDIITVSDSGFETYLIGLVDASGGGNDDGYIQATEAERFTGTITYTNNSLVDATGLEAFINTTNINLSQNSLETIDLSQNTEITQLRLYNNDLTTLDLTANDQLEYIMAYSNNLSSVQLTASSSLLSIGFNNNPNLSSFDATDFPNLRYIDLAITAVSMIDVTENPDLTYLQISGTNVSSLDVSNNLLLETLGIGNLGFNGFDLSNHTALEYITVSGNIMGDLDLSNHSNLIRLYAQDAGLTTLNIRNNNNSAILTLSVQSNPNLTCIIADDSSLPNGRTGWSKDVSARYDSECLPTVTVNDEGLEAFLLSIVDAANGGNDDGYIQVSEAESYTGAITYRNKGLTDATGLEAFVNINKLDLGVNDLMSIDVTTLTSLAQLNVNNNSLETIDISQNTNLTVLQLAANNIGTIDVSDLSILQVLYLFDNEISVLDVSNNDNLTVLAIQNLPSLNTIDISNNVLLQELEIYSTGILELDVADLTELTYLDISNTGISFLDLSNNGKLESLYANNSSLGYLNVKTGNKELISDLSLTGSIDLTCIEVDDVAYAEANWTDIDAGMSFNTECREGQEITLSAISDKLTIDEPFEVIASSNSELEIALTVSGPATIDGKTITLDGTAGTVTVYANQSGNESFQPAMEKSVSFEITKASQTITISTVENKLTTDNAFEVTASSNSELDVILTVSGPASISENNIITLDGTAGTVTVIGNQAGNEKYKAAEEVTISFEVSEPENTITTVNSNINQVIFYPNPATGWLAIQGLKKGPASVSIFDIQGINVFNESIETGDKLNISGINSGYYFVKLTQENFTTTTKILIQR